MRVFSVFILVLVLFLSCSNYNRNKETEAQPQVLNDCSVDLDSLYQIGLPRSAKIADSSQDISVFLNDDKKANYNDDAYTTSIYIYDHQNKTLSKLLTTTEPDGYTWYKAAGGKAIECRITDIHAISEARIFPYSKKLLVSGVYDMRNVFSYIIDIDAKSVLCLPTNGGLIGFTCEEGFAVMQSYAYNTGLTEEGDPVGGRHSLITIFSDDGKCLQTLSLEKYAHESGE